MVGKKINRIALSTKKIAVAPHPPSNVLLRHPANWNRYGSADHIAVSKQIKGNDGHLKYFKLNWGLCASL